MTANLPMPPQYGGEKPPSCNLRVSFFCEDVQGYIENPKSFLPLKPCCCNDPTHKVSWHVKWKREFLIDHVHVVIIVLMNAYCDTCHETISYWPEFVLPYQREPLETFEQVIVEYLQGISISKIAGKLGYDPRTVSRWIKRIFSQAKFLVNLVVRRILQYAGTETLPLFLAREAVKLLLAWLHDHAERVGFPRLYRLIGFCNLLGKGDWDFWGAPLGRARTRHRQILDSG